MNYKYIKRQLVLKELGIPMSEDVQRYYDLFNDIYSSNITMEYDSDSNVTNIYTLYKNNNILITTYNHIDKLIKVDTFHVLHNFIDIFNISETDGRTILLTFLEHWSKKEINSLYTGVLNINLYTDV